MLPEIISVNKSMHKRLEQFQSFLECEDYPCSDIKEVWTSMFEDLVHLGVDWKALWVLSEDCCKKYKLLFPTAVIVNVDNFCWPNLSAYIRVLAVQEDIALPSATEVPIIELYPIKSQEYDETELIDIADWLDRCRYFFKNLWYPWDTERNESLKEWCDAHLENRLKMHYDLKNGVFSKSICNYLKLLLAEAQNVNKISEKEFENEDEKIVVARKYLRRKTIKAELELFEEPDLRYGIIMMKKKEKNLKNSPEIFHNEEAKLVWMGGNCETLSNYLRIAQSLLKESVNLKICESLQSALEASNPEETIIITPGTHVLNLWSGIKTKNYLKGLNKSETIITPDLSTVAKAILLECFSSVELENLTISKPSGIAIEVFNGTVKIKNCKMTSKKNNCNSKGIVVSSGCKLFLEDCELEGFGTAIVLHQDTHLSAVNTKILDSCEGIKISENTSVSLHNVEIRNSSTFGICLESSEVTEDNLIGDITLLEDENFKCKVTATSVEFSGNVKGNVIVKKREKGFNFDELSDSDSFDDTIDISDDSSSNNSINDIQVTFDKAL